MLVAAVVVVVLISRPKTATSEVKRGVACPALLEVARQRSADDAARRRAATLAAAAGELALERSGQLFGTPELAALELRALYEAGHPAPRDVSRILTVARRACRRLGRWGG
jgi:hypothetical protein